MIPLTPGQIFHIYNRANGRENLFTNEGNYHFFLDKIELHLSPVCTIYSWCLMPNHFHLLAKIKNEPELQLLESLKSFKSSPEKFVSKQFSNLFSSYTQAYNKQ